MELITNDQLLTVFQIIIALSVLRVWIINFNKPSRWRGGEAKNMKEEFIAYGLPSWIMYLVGSLKVAFSIGLLAGLWIHEVVVFSASGIAIMMFFAIIMHAKIKDPLSKSIPAITFLVLSVLIILLER